MKKEFVVVLLAIGFIFAGVMTATAGTVKWTIIETTTMASHQPGADGLIGTADDGAAGTTRCNYSNATSCLTTGVPTTGSYSYALLQFYQESSCALGNKSGQTCTTNADCGGGLLDVCVDCNTGLGGVSLAYFAKNPTAPAAKGAGTMTADPVCDNGFDYKAMAIGTSEAVGADGGGCMTLGAFNSSTGCGAGTVSSDTDLKLWTSTIPNCGFEAGTMPSIALSGRIYAVPTVSAGACNYTTTQISNIMTDAGLVAGNYLFVACGNGTLPTNLKSGCLPGADWDSILVAKATVNVDSTCASECPSSCMAGTAEGVE